MGRKIISRLLRPPTIRSSKRAIDLGDAPQFQTFRQTPLGAVSGRSGWWEVDGSQAPIPAVEDDFANGRNRAFGSRGEDDLIADWLASHGGTYSHVVSAYAERQDVGRK